MNEININDINDLTRLYQLYMMIDKILSIQKNNGSDINHGILKKFKDLSLRINYLHSIKLSQAIQEYDYKTTDIYLEQERLSKLLQRVDDVYGVQKLLITKYSKYSLLPLSFENIFPKELYEVYKEKMDNINEYVKNEDYISKIEGDLNSLGISLGENVHFQSVRENKLLEYEDDLLSYVLNNDSIVKELKKNGIDIVDFSKDENKFSLAYDEINSLYQDAFDKYDAMSLVVNSKYDDVVSDISKEYNKCKFNKILMDIVSLLLCKESKFDDVLSKRNKIKKYIDDIGYDVYGLDFVKFINTQLHDIMELDKINNDINNIKKEINKNNTLLNRIKNRQRVLMNNIDNLNKYKERKRILKNQVINIKDSSIDYSSEKVKNVLNFVFNKINNVKENLDDELIDKEDDVFVSSDEDKVNSIFEDNIFVENSSNAFENRSTDDDKNINDNLVKDEDIFIPLNELDNSTNSNELDNNDLFYSFNQKIEEDDKIFDENTEDIFKTDSFINDKKNNNNVINTEDIFIPSNEFIGMGGKIEDKKSEDIFINEEGTKSDDDIFVNNSNIEFDPVKNNSNINIDNNEPFWPN